jgi:hypothetical protein
MISRNLANITFEFEHIKLQNKLYQLGKFGSNLIISSYKDLTRNIITFEAMHTPLILIF